MKILVTGGCGYVGSKLVPRLIEEGHQVLVVDDMWFGNFLEPNKNLSIIKKFFAEISLDDLENVNAVIHLANVANDPSVELNPVFSWEINVLHTTQLLELCRRRSSIKHFIYASSGSVYGVKTENNVTEDLALVPISAYNKTKMSAERVCLSYVNDFAVHVVRPATVCGVSPRMRFDVVVNMFVLQAFRDKKITVLGGDQIRPNIHIDDMAAVYVHFINNPDLESGSYNAGFENISVMSIAELVAANSDAEILTMPSNDPRSYRQDSSKLMRTGFSPHKSVRAAVDDIFDSLLKGSLKDDERWHTVSWMRKNNIGAPI